MTIHEFEGALKEVSSGASKLAESKKAAATGNVPSMTRAELIETFRSLNTQLLSLAPHIAQAFCCKASMVKFIKTVVESAGYAPEFRDGVFSFFLHVEKDEMTWDEYFGGEHDKGTE